MKKLVCIAVLLALPAFCMAAQVRPGAGAASGVGAVVLVHEIGPLTGTKKYMWKIEGKSVKKVTPINSLFLTVHGGSLPSKFESKDQARSYISSLIRNWIGTVELKNSKVYKAWMNYLKNNELNQLSYHLKYKFKLYDKVKKDYVPAVASWRVFVFANGGYATSDVKIYTAAAYLMRYFYLAHPDEPFKSWVENNQVASQLKIPFGSLWLEVYDLVTGTRHTDVEVSLGYCSPDPATGTGCLNYKLVNGYDPVYVPCSSPEEEPSSEEEAYSYNQQSYNNDDYNSVDSTADSVVSGDNAASEKPVSADDRYLRLEEKRIYTVDIPKKSFKRVYFYGCSKLISFYVGESSSYGYGVIEPVVKFVGNNGSSISSDSFPSWDDYNRIKQYAYGHGADYCPKFAGYKGYYYCMTGWLTKLLYLKANSEGNKCGWWVATLFNNSNQSRREVRLEVNFN